MENASKALIIAGSILVSIVIITLGVAIVSNVTETIQKNSNLSEQEIATYNEPFNAYLGTRSGTQVKNLLSAVVNHNNANIDDESRQIIAQNSDASGVTSAPTQQVSAAEINALKQQVKSGKTYTVSLGYDSNSGLIVAVGFVEKTK